MHTAKQLDASMFTVEIDGRALDRDALFPGWHQYDRLGVVVHDPLGGVGASLLVQLAITAFYDQPGRRNGPPRYPEIYLFHVGGRYGNHSQFDYWPPRKEVFLENDAPAVLDAINERAITRLAVVDGEPAAVQYDYTEKPEAEEQILSAFTYSASGRVTNPDVVLSGRDPQTEVNATMTIHPDRALAQILSLPGFDLRNADPKDQATIGKKRFETLLMSRIHEVNGDALRTAVEQRERIVDNGLATETYRRISVGEALGLLAKPEAPVR